MDVPILMYHQISDTPFPAMARYCQTRAQFTRQMRWLAARGYTTLSLDDLVRCRGGERPWPERPIVITIDDGYADAVETALTVLPRFGFTATVFLVTGYVGTPHSWDSAGMPLARWDLLRELSAAGFECGSHTVTHPRLATLPPDDCARELGEAKAQIEDRLGTPARHLAYPYGSVNDTVRRLAADAGYETACSIVVGLSEPDDDLLMLRRVHILGDDGFADFVCRLRTGRPLREMMHAAIRRYVVRR